MPLEACQNGLRFVAYVKTGLTYASKVKPDGRIHQAFVMKHTPKKIIYALPSWSL
jgi:hypothetical protein